MSIFVLFNITNDSFGIVVGFQKLSLSFRIYLMVIIGLNYGLFYFCVFLHMMQPRMVWDVLRSFTSYWFYSPIYNHILLIFSFCNIDDVTWGTKGLTADKENTIAK